MNARVIRNPVELVAELRQPSGRFGKSTVLCHQAADTIDEACDWLRACLSLVEGGGPPNWDGIREFLGSRAKSTMREWLVIEDSRKNSVFAPDDAQEVKGYIPCDGVEPLLGMIIEDGRTTWFTKEDEKKMRAHPEWRTTEPSWSPLGFWAQS